jgi:hypothetical protein
MPYFFIARKQLFILTAHWLSLLTALPIANELKLAIQLVMARRPDA